MFKSYIQDQDFLLPPSFRDFLSEDHEAVILSDLIDSLDLSLLRESYKNQFLGTTAYDPRMLLKVLIYAYSHKTFSSRSIASCLHSDIAFMYLAGLGKPDFRTINRFRKEKGYLLESIFTQIVLLAKNLGMIAFGTVSLDGTKIYANASREKNETMASLEKTISGLIQSAKDIDDLEDEVFGENDGRQIPEELKTREGRQKKLQELNEQREKAENLKQEIISRIESSKAMREGPKAKQEALEKARVNTTDPSARMMQMKRKDFANGYNGQIVTENQIILSSFVSGSPTDTKELIPTIEKFFHQYGMFPKDLLADSGYFSGENCSFLEQNRMEAYIPPQTERIGDTSSYQYDPTEDTYTDKSGNIFIFKSHVNGKNGTGKQKRGRKPKQYNVNDAKIEHEKYHNLLYVCKNHPSGKQKFLSISPELERQVHLQKERLQTDEGKQLFSLRQHDVEPVFARIKYHLGFTRFSLRGIEGVSIEWNLISMTHNLKKIMKFQIG